MEEIPFCNSAEELLRWISLAFRVLEISRPLAGQNVIPRFLKQILGIWDHDASTEKSTQQAQHSDFASPPREIFWKRSGRDPVEDAKDWFLPKIIASCFSLVDSIKKIIPGQKRCFRYMT